ncbi:hypothetical protein [Leifsonia sp. RAF41]|uniref:hypothetical protein n=1 Tax=Leifsonia sp. RAF41 TaxID=3233056 RepID=UPI003F9B541C
MRKIVYAGSTFYTGDLLAEALLEYAAALARADTAATIFIPALDEDGTRGEIEVLIGPASQLATQPSDGGWPEVVDDVALARLRTLTAELAPLLPTFEPPFQGGEWDESDDLR